MLPFIGLGGEDGAQTYEIEHSLNLNVSTANGHLLRGYSVVGDRRNWSVGISIKRCVLGGHQHLFGAFSSVGNSEQFGISDDQLYYYREIGGVLDGEQRASAKLRDTSAWYHIWVSKGAGVGAKLFVNGEQQALLIDDASSSDFGFIGAAQVHSIGRPFSTALPDYFQGYVANVRYLDGLVLEPTADGEVDADTRAWLPKRYVGGYGINGTHLLFDDNSSPLALGQDRSGNNNYFTLNSLSSDDSVTDTPTDNFALLNPLDLAAGTLSEGNLKYVSGGTNAAHGSIFFDSGKYVAEATLDGGTQAVVGIIGDPWPSGSSGYNHPGDTGAGTVSIGYLIGGTKGVNGSFSAYGAAYTTNDVIRVEVDADVGEVEFFKNGVSQGTITFTPGGAVGFSAGGYGVGGGNWTWNFGQKPFSHTPTVGFNPLSTKNLPDPLIAQPNQHFDTLLYTGDGSTANRSITGLDFQPDFAWFKNRAVAANHVLFDSVRTSFRSLFSNDTSAEVDEGEFVSFDPGGLTFKTSPIYDRLNSVTGPFVVWCWKRGVTPGFDVVGYTGDGVPGRTIGHGLGDAPAMMIVKNRDAVSNWFVYHQAAGASPQDFYLTLEATSAFADNANPWNDTAPTASVFTVGATGWTNTNGQDYVAYMFAEVPGFSRIGGYVGNGSADGSFVWCGFRPAFVLIKRLASVSDWIVLDSERDPQNFVGRDLQPDKTDAELALSEDADFLSNGFKLRRNAANFNAVGSDYIFAAFAEHPFKHANAR